MFECFNICFTDRQVNVLLKILPILFDCHLPFMVWQIAESTEVCDKSVSNSIFELLHNSVVIYVSSGTLNPTIPYRCYIYASRL